MFFSSVGLFVIQLFSYIQLKVTIKHWFFQTKIMKLNK